MTFLAPLNPKQREAVEHDGRALLVIAGAGSGKTRVVVSRIAHLVVARDVDPSSILGVTFTNKAAGEMRERVVGLLREHGWSGSRTPTLSTFHSFCARLLRIHGGRLNEIRPGFGTDFVILDEADQIAVVKDAVRQVGPAAQALKPKKILSAIGRWKSSNGRGSPLFGRDTNETLALQSVFELYRTALLAANALDFDDLLLETVRLLKHSDALRELLRVRYRHVLVDEFQDTNPPQYRIMRLLVGRGGNVCAVGDEDQAIYSWRGADISNILGFETDFPGTRVIRLEQNYRSTRSILRASSAVVAHNRNRRKKELWSAGPEGDLPVLLRAENALAEARFVVQEIGNLLDRDPDITVGVLYRTNAQSRLFEEELRRAGHRFLVVGGVAFYQRAEVKNILAYLRAAMSEQDSVSLRRILNVPARGIGKTTLRRLLELASKEEVSLWQAIGEVVERRLLGTRAQAALAGFRLLMKRLRERLDRDKPEELIDWILQETGYGSMLEADRSGRGPSRLENVRELLSAAREVDERGDSLQDLLDHAALVADSDGIDQSARVLLLTLHNAKGLEFSAVAMVGMEEKLLPHQRSLDAGEVAVEEERRLCYVGMTRARQHLLMSCAASRRLYGGGEALEMRPSRFLREIPADLIDDRLVKSSWYGSGRRADTGVPLRRRRPNPVATSGVKTHDSVSAVAAFFQDHGISPRSLSGNSPSPEASPSSVARGPLRQGGSGPNLGQAVRKLRRQGRFPPGSRVRHPKYGLGRVQRRDGEGDRAKLSVYFSRYGLKRLVAGYASLEEV